IVPVGVCCGSMVTNAPPPRWLSRAGLLPVTFTGLTLPDGNSLPLTASLAGVELSRGSHTKIDVEGRLRGDKPGAAWMLINGGAAYGTAKAADDGLQLIIEAIVSTATDVSTAGT